MLNTCSCMSTVPSSDVSSEPPRVSIVATGGPSARLGAVRFRHCDLALEDFAGGPLRQLVHHPDDAGILVGRDPLLHVFPQLIRGGLLALLERDRGCHLLAE